MARKTSMWAKAAGEYYYKNKGQNGIESFSDVLKSPEFKAEYNAKYGKHGKTMGKKDRKGKGVRNTRRYRGGAETTAAAVAQENTTVTQSTDVNKAVTQGEEQGEEQGGSAVEVPKDVAGGNAVAQATLPAVTGGKRKGSKKRRSAKKSSYKLW
jgi:hypothetical protein